MKRLLLLLTFAAAAFAQNNITGLWTFTTVAPSGSCNPGQAWVLMPTGALYTCVNGTPTLFTGSGAGVTSVNITVPSALLSISGCPITTSGTCAIALPTRAANLVFAGPTTGAAAAPAFRALVAADIPTIPISTGVSGLGSGVATALAIAHDSPGGVCTVGGGGCTGSSVTAPTINVDPITVTGTSLVSAWTGTIAAGKYDTKGAFAYLNFTIRATTTGTAFSLYLNSTQAISFAASGASQTNKMIFLYCKIYSTGANLQSSSCKEGEPTFAGDENLPTSSAPAATTENSGSAITVDIRMQNAANPGDITLYDVELLPVNY